jgi:hypothetical protein
MMLTDMNLYNLLRVKAASESVSIGGGQAKPHPDNDGRTQVWALSYTDKKCPSRVLMKGLNQELARV